MNESLTKMRLRLKSQRFDTHLSPSLRQSTRIERDTGLAGVTRSPS